jgi:hypothetical protein
VSTHTIDFRAAAENDSPPLQYEYLTGARCGGVGETALKDFATKPSREFSVGFVSMGAALLLAANLFRSVLFAEGAPARDDMAALNYLIAGMMDANLSAEERCEKRCQNRR